MNIFLVGGTGFIGGILTRELVNHGHRLTLLVRPRKERFLLPDVSLFEGDPTRPGTWQQEMLKHDVIINLAGTPIFRRWTRGAKKDILESRIRTTHNIVAALTSGGQKRIQLFSASGVGYYGFHGDETLTEVDPPGSSFMAFVARHWEYEAGLAALEDFRVVLCRFGIVLGRNGGALPKIVSLVKMHSGARLGSGRQWFSWIHEQDVANAFLFLLERREIAGAVNITSPHPVRNACLMRSLVRITSAKTVIPRFPGFLLRLVLGEFAVVFTEGQRVIPAVLLKNGFQFKYGTLEDALKNLLQQQGTQISIKGEHDLGKVVQNIQK